MRRSRKKSRQKKHIPPRLPKHEASFRKNRKKAEGKHDNRLTRRRKLTIMLSIIHQERGGFSWNWKSFGRQILQ